MTEESEKKEDNDIESHIQTAISSRIPYSLTFEGVRRLLEKDLGFEAYTFDVHKAFIKQCLLKCLKDAGDVDGPNVYEDNVASTQETEKPKGECQSKDEKDVCREDEEKMEGLKITMAGLRRLLEEDLNLDKFTLDPYKKLISYKSTARQVIASSEVLEPPNNAKKIVKKKHVTKATEKFSSKENSDTSDNESGKDENEDGHVKPGETTVLKGKNQTSVGPKKCKEEESNLSSKKRVKTAKAASEDDSDTENNGKNSEDTQSHSSPEKPSKKKEVSTPVYVFLPQFTKKVKHAPKNRRERQLIKELEEILSREGLYSNPFEKEIKEVRRKKDKAKELEGIDMSNIVSSSRRRSTTSFAASPSPKPKTLEKN
ncbi:hypothetical protein TanjilG_12691 [Lupinus angustifolius]|uniref:Histone chaperone domain-containing protein n=1 Tax=Lupinus angustifolius TaxID=3871 RepID=A0A4P1QZ74_LUPAN|nr:hypothetical protein TanjilG_12691 [Lupinus angustifolius]